MLFGYQGRTLLSWSVLEKYSFQASMAVGVMGCGRVGDIETVLPTPDNIEDKVMLPFRLRPFYALL